MTPEVAAAVCLTPSSRILNLVRLTASYGNTRLIRNGGTKSLGTEALLIKIDLGQW